MKKLRLQLFFTIALSHLCILLQAQIEYSARLAPNLSIAKTTNVPYSNNPINSSPLLRGSIGLSSDFFFLKSRLAFSTGIWYTIKGLDLASDHEVAIDKPDGSRIYYENGSQYNLHYVQLPFTLKFFISNKSANSRFYIQGGLILDWKIAEQALKKEENYLHQLSQTFNSGRDVFNSKDKGLYLGFGSEWRTKKDRMLFASLSFTKGMNWQVTKEFKLNSNDYLRPYMDFRMSAVTLEVGFKFGSKKIPSN